MSAPTTVTWAGLIVGAMIACAGVGCRKAPPPPRLDGDLVPDAGRLPRKLPESFRELLDPTPLRPSSELVLDLNGDAANFKLRGDNFFYRDQEGAVVRVSLTSKERETIPCPCANPRSDYELDDSEVCCVEPHGESTTHILCAPRTGGASRVLREGLSYVSQMAMDPTYVYLALNDSPGVTRVARKDGRVLVHQGGGERAWHFAVDGDTLYWSSNDGIFVGAVAPTTIRQVWRGNPAEGPIAVGPEAAFWADTMGPGCVPGNPSVWRRDKKTGRYEAVAIHEDGARTMAVTSRNLYWWVDGFDALRRVDARGYTWLKTVGRHMKIDALFGDGNYLYWTEKMGDRTQLYRHDERTEE